MSDYKNTGLLLWLGALASCGGGPEPVIDPATGLTSGPAAAARPVNASAPTADQEDAPAKQEDVAERPVPRSIESFPPAPEFPAGPLALGLTAAVDDLFGEKTVELWGREQKAALQTVSESKDPRIVWLLADRMRITRNRTTSTLLSSAAFTLMEMDAPRDNVWGTITDHMIAWDIPAPPGYLDYKRNIFTVIVPEWEKLFQPGNVDWRLVTWGGVGIDDRPFDKTDERCSCIPAADNPEVTSAAEAEWLEDGDVVFGVEIGGEYRAYPRQIMEVREMVNDTLGGRDIGMPYCTLCGSAQAYFTDGMPDGVERPVLRTSGLLIRSNKLMFDLNTFSVFDTFLGTAVTGPLAGLKIELPQASVVTANWGDWKREHPVTTVLAEKLALGRDFDFRNGRDANGPIFPIGDMDPRLRVQDDVVGVVTASGQAIAFPLEAATKALKEGKEVGFENVKLRLDAGGLRAVDLEGKDLGSHQAFWFAWSQFYPGTLLWGE